MNDCSRCKSERALMKLQGIKVSYCDLCGKKLVNKTKKKKSGFSPCPNRSWHHLGTTCKVCGQRG